MTRLEPVLMEKKPEWAIVYGDVNSTLASTLVCSKLQIKLAHVEAGLRSFDRTMPEEINRLVTDQLSDLLFTPSADADENLLREEMAQWIMSLQHEDGSLPGGFGGKPHKPSVFNTGQMIFGLLSAYRVSSEKSFLSAASRAAQWLASVQEDDGSWTRYGYHPGFSPSYYSRVAWPMLMVWRLTGEDSLRLKAEKSLVLIAGRQHDRLKSIRDWGFHPGNAAFTHTIAYTIRGLLESSRLLEGGRKYWEIGEQAAMLIFRRFELKNQLAGQFSDDMKGDYRFTCLTGNCQMALCWTLLAARNGDARLLNAAIKAVSLVAKKQRLHTRDKNLRGAIPGSAPIWGRYLTLRYPNWAAKFYMDTLMEIEDLLNPQPLAREHQ